MSFLRSIVLLASVSCFLVFVLLAGYGLAIRAVGPALIGMVFLVISLALVFAQVKVGRARV